MELQQILALVVVAGSAAYLVRKTVIKRRRAAQMACADDCGCEAGETMASRISLKADAKTKKVR